MKKKQNVRRIVFIEDYANKVAGTEMSCDVVMASQLILSGVAELKEGDAVIEKPKPVIKKVLTKTKSKK